jgi:hypothetical protein
MNKKLVSFPVNIFTRASIVLAWIEAQIQCAIFPILHPNTITSYVNALQGGALRMWKSLQKTPAAGLYAREEITCTNILTPALLFMHFRMMMESRHYSRLDAAQMRKAAQESTRLLKSITGMMPTWEKSYRRSVINEQEERRFDWKNRFKTDSLTSTGLYGVNVVSSIWRYIAACFIMAVVSVLLYWFIVNQTAVFEWIARLLISMTGLTFLQAYGVFVVCFLSLTVVTTMVAIDLFRGPTIDDVMSYVYEHDENTQETLAELADIINNDIKPRLGNVSEPSIPVADELESIQMGGHA